MAGDRRLVRNAIASYFGGSQPANDPTVCYQGGPLVSYGLGTAYPYSVRHVPDSYYTQGMPDGQNWGAVLGVTKVDRVTTREAMGGPVSGWRGRRYTITCELSVIAELPHIEVAGAGLDDLIEAIHGLIYNDRTLGTTSASLYPTGRLIWEAGEGRTGIRDMTDRFEMLDGDKGRYAAQATVDFQALTMVAA